MIIPLRYLFVYRVIRAFHPVSERGGTGCIVSQKEGRELPDTVYFNPADSKKINFLANILAWKYFVMLLIEYILAQDLAPLNWLLKASLIVIYHQVYVCWSLVQS